MAATMTHKKSGYEAGSVSMMRIRITMTSTNVKDLEAACNDLKSSAAKESVAMTGPVRMPTKKLVIVTRKSPCGEGTNTWDRFEMRIHKRVLDMVAPAEMVKTITNVTIQPTVRFEVHRPRDGRKRFIN